MNDKSFPLLKIFRKIKTSNSQIKIKTKRLVLIIFLIIFVSSFFGFLAGTLASSYFYLKIKDFLTKLDIVIPERLEVSSEIPSYSPQTSQEQAVIKTVEEASPAVISIIITKDVPVIEEYYTNPFGDFFGEGFGFQVPQYRQKGTEKREIGGGSGFIISEDGMILTNKHVVLDEKAEYTVFTSDGNKFPAKVLAKDPFQDLAVIKIEEEGISFPTVKLGDSDALKIGQTVVAIGNALGEFRNTVSVGVISGLGRSITASGGDFVETIEDVIQTDAAINSGNSGGPLLNLKGEVVGVNTATVIGAQSIGFAIPINKAKRDIEQVRKEGKITYAFLGIYYTLITPELKEKHNLTVDYGAWIGRGSDGNPSIRATFVGSAAEKAGLQRDDIILEFDGQKINQDNSLAKIILDYKPGDEVSLKILRHNQEKIIKIVLGENKG